MKSTMDNTLNIAFGIDEEYLQHFTVALVSILENNKDLLINVFLIHDIENLDKALAVKDFFEINYQVELVFLRIDSAFFQAYPDSVQYPKAIYYRLLVANIIPERIDRLLYLDSDIVVTGKFQELLNLDFMENCLFAAEEFPTLNIIRLNKLGIPLTKYFNSGVLFLNLKLWRKQDISNNLLKSLDRYKYDILYPDQDILNIFFMNDWKELKQTYNPTDIAKVRMEKIPPILIHYMGGSKPWHYLNEHPYKYLYWKYLAITPFKDYVSPGYRYQRIFRKPIYWFKSRIYLIFYSNRGIQP